MIDSLFTRARHAGLRPCNLTSTGYAVAGGGASSTLPSDSTAVTTAASSFASPVDCATVTFVMRPDASIHRFRLPVKRAPPAS